jgi:hypothetical protein
MIGPPGLMPEGKAEADADAEVGIDLGGTV